MHFRYLHGVAILKTDGMIPVEEYLAGELVAETKHEYLGGAVYAMAGAKVGHDRVAGNILFRLMNALEGKPCEPFGSDMKVRIELPEQTRFYYPDAILETAPGFRKGF